MKLNSTIRDKIRTMQNRFARPEDTKTWKALEELEKQLIGIPESDKLLRIRGYQWHDNQMYKKILEEKNQMTNWEDKVKLKTIIIFTIVGLILYVSIGILIGTLLSNWLLGLVAGFGFSIIYIYYLISLWCKYSKQEDKA